MAVWDVPDARVPRPRRALTGLPFVTLCYRRPRRPPLWPYNLFCMIHGKDRALVEAEVEEATAAAGLSALPRGRSCSAAAASSSAAPATCPRRRDGRRPTAAS